MLRQRLWLTIVNDETAQQGVERGRYGALLCALLFAILAVDGWRLHQGQGTEGMTIFAVAYLFAAWRIYRGSAVLMEVALIFLPFGVHAACRYRACSQEDIAPASRIYLCLVGSSY
jgi:hypothetical protein